jgi:Ca2+-binding EF-hand superfamily protein
VCAVAFNLFDEDRAGVISGAQIRTVLKTFYSEARHVLVELMGQIEDIYGMDIAVVSTRGTTYKVRWSEEPSLQRVFASLEKKLADERWRMVDYSLDFREQGQVDGLSFNGFCKWCSTNNDRSRLRMLEWMKVLGGLWLQRMGLAKHANDPVQHHHPAACKHKHPGRFHPQHHAYPPARSEFQVSKIPMLGQVFHRLTQAQLTKAFGRANAFGIRTGALDNFVVGANQSASGNLGRYENALELSEAEFERCLTRLGVKHPPLQKRFFKVFERRLQKEHYGRSTPIVGAFGFIEPREFMAGLQLLMLRDRDEKFDMVFKMFDVQGRGFIGEAEMHRLINLFFLVAHDAVRSIIHTFEYLLGKDVAMEKEIRAAGARLQRHYADVVTQAVFSNLAPDGPDSVKRLDLSELKQWSAENGGRLRDWFDCLGYHWLASIEKTVPEIDGLAVVPEGLLLNLMGAYDMDPERPLSDDEHYKMLQRSMWNAKSDSAFKAESQKQPNGYSSGAPAIPPPNCTFQPSKVKAIQVLFSKLGGADGVMSSLEWKRCLSAAGVYNEWVSDRLFALFDSSGDQEMNAKEFTWGLSDICSEAPHPGTKMTPFEVRQAFAYRFYDTDLSGYFEKDECKQFLLSWQQACDLAVTRALDKFVRVFGLGKEYLQTMEAEQDIVADRKRIAELGDEIQRELIRFNDELFVLFTGTYGTRMNYENFKEFTKKSPIAVDWLTDLGTHLQKQFPTLSGMTFDDSDPKIDPHATELSQARMRKSFRACSTKGVMRANDLVKLLQKQGVSTNEFFGKLLFRVIDGDGNGTVTEDEFVDAMTRTIMGTPEERLRTVYRMVDTTKAGFVSSKALRAFLQSWFDMALEQVQSVASGLDEWLNGRVTTTGHTLSSSGPPRVGGLNAQLFVPSSRQPKPRDANLEVPVNMRKKSSSRVSLLVDYMVDEAMDFAQSSNLSKGKHLYSDEFTQWLSNRTQFIDWLARIGAQWMVTPKQADEENDASKVGPAARRPVRRTDAVAIPTKAPVDPLAAVITAADIGRSISSVVYTATTGEPDFGAELQAEVASGPGSKWWARSLRDRAHVRPSQLRPATHFDSIDLADIEAVFASDVAARRIYDKAKFRTKLRHERLKFKSTLVMDKLYSMFDVNGDGLLDVEEAGCGLVLLATGETVERRRLAFDLFDVGKNDDIQEQDMRVFLRAFTRVAMEVMSSMLERLSELFGPEPKSSREKKDDEEYRMKLLKRAVEKLEAATEQMIRVAFAADVNQDRSLSWQEFELWAEENPTFSTWMEQLGLSCLESIATTEDRSVPHVGGERPVPSTFRARRKYPNGTSFERLRVYQVRAIFGSYATFGQLNPDRFAACLHKLKVYSPYTVRRLFALFDRDGGGGAFYTTLQSVAAAACRVCYRVPATTEYLCLLLWGCWHSADVSMREFASGFFLLCGGGLEEKLAEAFVLYDDDGNGFLDGQEMRSLFESFYTIAMDVVCCSLSTSTAVLQADRSFGEYVAGVLPALLLLISCCTDPILTDSTREQTLVAICVAMCAQTTSFSS